MPSHPPAQMPIRPEWLALHREPALDPGQTIVDAHHHLWDPPGARYLLDAFRADVGTGHAIVASVYVEGHAMHRADGPAAMRPVGETEFAAGIAAQCESGLYGDTRLCAGIIGFVDLTLGDAAAEVLDAHIAAGGGRFRGIRGRVSSHPDPRINKWRTPAGVLRADSTRAAVAAIADRGLSLDIWAYQTQHDDIIDLCDRFPEIAVVIDHAGGPLGCPPYDSDRASMFADWSRGIAALARRPNTVMKIGGFGMRFAGFGFAHRDAPPSSDDLVAAWGDHVSACIDTFGPDRCMFASNFPADKGAGSYAVLWNAFKKCAGGYTRTERDALFHATAIRTYRLPLQTERNAQ